MDELSANIGMLISLETDEEKWFRNIQNKLLDIGSYISITAYNKKEIPDPISESDISEIESRIDYMESKNTTLTEFILVGVNKIDSQSHICRSVCRRAERSLVRYYFKIVAEYPQFLFQYINRLSDFFFVYDTNLVVQK